MLISCKKKIISQSLYLLEILIVTIYEKTYMAFRKPVIEID